MRLVRLAVKPAMPSSYLLKAHVRAILAAVPFSWSIVISPFVELAQLFRHVQRMLQQWPYGVVPSDVVSSKAISSKSVSRLRIVICL